MASTCDTLVVLGNSSEDGSVIFGKNSDRDVNEAHAICYVPRAFHEVGEQVKCQYVTIPQVKETFALILSKPVWLNIGCEMGANEHGVVMGNEAVFTKEKYERQALLGMDLMRIALERAKMACDAMNIITTLISKHGQGGVASLYDPNFVYHNSFIIADPKEAWILETADRYWVAKKVQDVGSISNGLTIQDEWDLASSNLVENAIEKGWCDSKSEFNFAECYSDPELRVITGCIDRQSRTINFLLDHEGKINPSMIMGILKDHGSKSKNTPFSPIKGMMDQICMHYGLNTVSQTTASYVADLSKDLNVHWLTGTAVPCLSIFKPFFFENPEALQKIKIPSLKNDDVSLWWKHEKLHRHALLDYINRAPMIIEENKKLQDSLTKKVREVINRFNSFSEKELRNKLNEISKDALEENFSILDDLIEKISKMEIKEPVKKAYLKKWEKFSQEVGMKLEI